MSQGNHQLIIFLCDADEAIVEEMTYSDFDSLQKGERLLESYAASVQTGCFCVVGAGLTLQAVVFFLLPIDEHGRVDPGFNLPLLYLAEQAPVTANVGQGDIQVASRGQCAIPWHSLNLWEPEGDEFVHTLQQRIYRNRLKLKSVISDGVVFKPEAPSDVHELPDFAGTDRPTMAVAPVAEGNVALSAAFTERLDQVFGADGHLSMQDLIRLHSDQLAQAKRQYRTDIEEQQAAYLAQIREAKDEIRELKVALRQEQSRNRRLQETLRREP